MVYESSSYCSLGHHVTVHPASTLAAASHPQMDVVWTPKFAAAGWLLDLTDRVTLEELAAFSPKDVEGGRYENRLYRMPVRSDAGVLYYREDLLKAAGFEPPETFEDLMQISKALQKLGLANWGYVWQGRQY